MGSEGKIQTFIRVAFAAALCLGCKDTTLVPISKGSPFPSAGGAFAPPPVKQNFDGLGCKTDEECESGHCSNRICCEKGECCKVAEDCGLDTKDSLVCEDSATCQGSRGSVACNTSYRCVIKEGGTPDDSGCDTETEASDCGRFKPAFCNGMKDQRAPVCSTSCTTDEECDATAHCINATCIANLPNGSGCGADTECESQHCNHGFCCAMGDCCAAETDCDPTTYTSAPACTDPSMCQGTRQVPACMDNQCGTRMEENDSACDRNIEANACDGLPVKCRGGVDQQPPPPCATGTCGVFTANTCNPGAFCWENRCTPDQPDGESCTDDTSCQSGHCENNVCCAEGDCCTSDDQCPAIMTCANAMICEGKRQDRHCDLDHGKCEDSGPVVDDDSGCAGSPTGLNCEGNFAAPCSAAAVQQPPTPTTGGCIPCTTIQVCVAMQTLVCGCTDYAPQDSDGDTFPENCPAGYDTGRKEPRSVGCVGGPMRTCSIAGKCM